MNKIDTYPMSIDQCDHPFMDDCGYTCHCLECNLCGLLIVTEQNA